MAGHKKSKEERAEARAKYRAEREEKARAEQLARREKKSAEGRAASAEGASAKREPVELTPQQLAKKEVTGVGTRMKKLLRDSGKYDPSLTYQVEQAATTLTIMRKIAGEILTAGSAVTLETSREGNGRAKINPLFDLYLKFDSANRHNLRALSMNRENMKTADDQLDDGEDAVVALLRDVAKDDDEIKG